MKTLLVFATFFVICSMSNVAYAQDCESCIGPGAIYAKYHNVEISVSADVIKFLQKHSEVNGTSVQVKSDNQSRKMFIGFYLRKDGKENQIGQLFYDVPSEKAVYGKYFMYLKDSQVILEVTADGSFNRFRLNPASLSLEKIE